MERGIMMHIENIIQESVYKMYFQITGLAHLGVGGGVSIAHGNYSFKLFSYLFPEIQAI